MNKSDSIKAIGTALLKFDAEMTKIGKTATNPFFKNTYAPLPEILDKIKDPLQKSGLTVKQFPDGEHGMTTIIIHPESGEWLESTYQMKPSKDDPQGEGSRITYQRRYALGAALGLNIDVDDDGNAASQPQKQPEKREQAKEQPWLNEKQLAIVVERIRNHEFGELKTLEAFVANVYNTYKVSKDMREKISMEIDAVMNHTF
jgi:hypothetical protein